MATFLAHVKKDLGLGQYFFHGNIRVFVRRKMWETLNTYPADLMIPYKFMCNVRHVSDCYDAIVLVVNHQL